MNPENPRDELGTLVSREMHRRVDGFHDAPLGFEAVRGKATSIRRRRQLAAGLGVAAAVAVIVPTAMFATQGTNADGQLPATQAPTVVDSNGATPTVTPTMGADPHALDVSDLPTGAPPAVTVLTSDDLAVARTAEALVRWTPDGVVVEAKGRTFGPYASSNGFDRNVAGTAVAWATDAGEVMVWADGASGPSVVADPGLESLRVVAVTGTDCSPQASGCTIYLSGYDTGASTPEALALTSGGEVEAVDPQRVLITVRDATDDGRVLGHTEINDLEASSCSAVLDPAQNGSRPVWETCKHALDGFSPQGGYVLASGPYADGIGPGQIAVYDARTGDLLADRMNRTRDLVFYNDAVWEDETHVLFTAYQDGEWSIVRMGVDGAMEYAIPPQKGGEMKVPWRFETR